MIHMIAKKVESLDRIILMDDIETVNAIKKFIIDNCDNSKCNLTVIDGNVKMERKTIIMNTETFLEHVCLNGREMKNNR